MVLATDNIAAKSKITKGYIAVSHVCSIVRFISKWKLEKKLHLSIRWIPGHQNAAETLSRNSDITSSRNTAT